LKYAGIEPERIRVVDDLARALAGAAAERPAPAEQLAAPERPEADGSAPLYVLPTYTAMLALRELLVRRGEAVSSWR
jgi:hypothetical protein